jgi:hypothetical protein
MLENKKARMAVMSLRAQPITSAVFYGRENEKGRRFL